VARIGVRTDSRIYLLKPNGDLLAAGGLGDDSQATSPLDAEDIATAQPGQPEVTVDYSLLRQSGEAWIPITGVDRQLLGIVAVTKTLEGLASLFARLRWWILGVLAIELLLGSLVGLVLALRLGKPIERSAQAVIALAHGQAVEPIAEQGPAEIKQLAVSVNLLSERLRLLEDTRRRSLANIVHELGRPLGAMRSAVHVLRGPVGDDPAVRGELLAGVEGQIERMQPLLDDLAQLHGQVSGQVTLAKRPVALSEWLMPILLPWRAAAVDKHLHWGAAIPDDLPVVAVDPDRLAPAIGNLLSNAIKYTPAGGRVEVTAGAAPQEVWMTVADTGPGIAPDEQTRVFEAFYRSDRDRRFPQGLGLGLTIARDLVVAHGGTLELESAPGEGSRFTVRLPREVERSETAG
jgi:signal transduction histidine kinase